MKKTITTRFIFLAVFSVLLFNCGINQLYAQKKVKKNKVRLNVEYFKITGSEHYFEVKASSRINRKNQRVRDVEVIVYNKLDDEKTKLGTLKTNIKGVGIYKLESLASLKADTSDTYNLVFTFKGNDAFKKASKSISFKDVQVEANVITKDSIHFLTGKLVNPISKESISDETLKVGVKRLFKSLPIGQGSYTTDENGTILVPIEEGIPGIDGVLKLEVALLDHDEYGTVKTIIDAPIGVPIVEESTFDERIFKSLIFVFLIASSK